MPQKKSKHYFLLYFFLILSIHPLYICKKKIPNKGIWEFPSSRVPSLKSPNQKHSKYIQRQTWEKWLSKIWVTIEIKKHTNDKYCAMPQIFLAYCSTELKIGNTSRRSTHTAAQWRQPNIKLRPSKHVTTSTDPQICNATKADFICSCLEPPPEVL